MYGFNPYGSYLGPTRGMNPMLAPQPLTRGEIIAAGLMDLGMAMQGQPGTHLPQLKYTQQLAMHNAMERERLKRKEEREEEDIRLKREAAEREMKAKEAMDRAVAAHFGGTEAAPTMPPTTPAGDLDLEAIQRDPENWDLYEVDGVPVAQPKSAAPAPPPTVAAPVGTGGTTPQQLRSLGDLFYRMNKPEQANKLYSEARAREDQAMDWAANRREEEAHARAMSKPTRTGPSSYQVVDPKTGITYTYGWAPTSPNANELGYARLGIAPREAGMEFEADPEGGFRFKQGGPAGLEQTTAREQDRIYRTSEDLSKLAMMRDVVKEEHFQAWEKLGNRFQEVMTQFGKKKLTPEQFESIASESEAGAAITSYVSLLRHELYGAQLTGRELKENLKQLPDFGYEFWQGDSYPRYVGKTRYAEKQLMMASARAIIAEEMDKNWRDFARYGLNVGSINTLVDQWHKVLTDRGATSKEADAEIWDKLGHLIVDM